LGAFAALIAASDVYIGYDSGGQHIAAALGVPVIDIFADDSIPSVTTRWTPTGPAPVHVIEHYKAPGETLEKALSAYRAVVEKEEPQ
jgi:ADP-heptose:LPS heptosyltransferase